MTIKNSVGPEKSNWKKRKKLSRSIWNYNWSRNSVGPSRIGVGINRWKFTLLIGLTISFYSWAG